MWDLLSTCRLFLESFDIILTIYCSIYTHTLRLRIFQIYICEVVRKKVRWLLEKFLFNYLPLTRQTLKPWFTIFSDKRKLFDFGISGVSDLRCAPRIPSIHILYISRVTAESGTLFKLYITEFNQTKKKKQTTQCKQNFFSVLY